MGLTLRDRGCTVVTSDPFLGLSSSLTFGELDPTRISRYIFRLLKRVTPEAPLIKAGSVRNLIQFYVTPTIHIDPADGARRIACNNPKLVHLKEKHRTRDVAEGAKNPAPHWLLVLAASDLKCQSQLHGCRRFVRMMKRTLEQAMRAGRKPILIAPNGLMKKLRSQLPAEMQAGLVGFCPYSRYIELLIRAEYVFYWNVFSFSLRLRVANELPVFFFDRGHMAVFDRLYRAGLKCHYDGWEPEYLDQQMPLDLSDLAQLASRQIPELRRIRAYWEQSPHARSGREAVAEQRPRRHCPS